MDRAEIRQKAVELENGPTEWRTVERLALLYVVLDHLDSPNTQPYTAESRISLRDDAESEFLVAVNGAPLGEVLRIINEHMEVIKLVYPKEYAAILKRVKSL